MVISYSVGNYVINKRLSIVRYLCLNAYIILWKILSLFDFYNFSKFKILRLYKKIGFLFG